MSKTSYITSDNSKEHDKSSPEPRHKRQRMSTQSDSQSDKQRHRTSSRAKYVVIVGDLNVHIQTMDGVTGYHHHVGWESGLSLDRQILIVDLLQRIEYRATTGATPYTNINKKI